MRTRYFALVVGIVYTLIGLLGFILGLLSLPISAPAIAIETGSGYLFDLFPVNIWHNIVHLIVGVLGFIAYLNWKNARLYARGLTIFYALLAVLGLIPATSTLFGFVPIFGHNVWLHALTAAIAAYFGYATPIPKDINTRIA